MTSLPFYVIILYLFIKGLCGLKQSIKRCLFRVVQACFSFSHSFFLGVVLFFFFLRRKQHDSFLNSKCSEHSTGQFKKRLFDAKESSITQQSGVQKVQITVLHYLIGATQNKHQEPSGLKIAVCTSGAA